MLNPGEASSIISSIFSKKTITVAGIAAGSLAVLLGGALYFQFDNEQQRIEALRKDIYSEEEIVKYLQDELYNCYPVLLKLVQWIPTFHYNLKRKLQGKRVTGQ